MLYFKNDISVVSLKEICCKLSIDLIIIILKCLKITKFNVNYYSKKAFENIKYTNWKESLNYCDTFNERLNKNVWNIHNINLI